MTEIRQRLKTLRMELLHRNLDAWYISGTDPHASEYLPEMWQTRQYITGFTGSYGIVVVAQEEAVLWTDSRYFIQAEEQLKGSGIKMQKLRVPDAIAPELWLSKKLARGSKIGFDPQTLSLNAYRHLSETLDPFGIAVVETPDLFEKIWADRPPLPANPVYELNSSITGLTRKDKKDMVSTELKKRNLDFQVITALDELAWAFNLRGSDISYNPLFIGYGVIGKNEWMLFIDPSKVSDQLKEQFDKEKINLLPYHSFFPWLKAVRTKKISLDPDSVSYAVYNTIHPDNHISESLSLVASQKMQKNTEELSGFREAMKKDGIALVEFLFWLKNEVNTNHVTEFTAGKKLAALRAGQKDYMGESFAPIVGYREHGAIVHLNVDEHEALQLKPEGMVLVDSGGQYLHGTTDVTRTIALGRVTPQEKTDYTLVLKGMIGLTQVKFPAGTKGCHIDVLARMALWQNGLNYGHGTGHGVGHFLNVHEGPVSIRQDFNNIALKPGMVLSNEPGLYRKGQYGIRIENLIVVIEKEDTEFGQFLGFEPLTLCPIEKELIDVTLLSEDEKNWLNEYHKQVKEVLTPLVRPELVPFLDAQTEEL